MLTILFISNSGIYLSTPPLEIVKFFRHLVDSVQFHVCNTYLKLKYSSKLFEQYHDGLNETGR